MNFILQVFTHKGFELILNSHDWQSNDINLE